MANASVSEPFPIFAVADRYLLYDVDTVMYIRRHHHMCGVLIGNIPSAHHQNLFSGIPLELMPEEARFLVENEYAYVIDDGITHQEALSCLGIDQRRQFRKQLEEEGLEAARVIQQSAAAKKAYGLAKTAQNKARQEKKKVESNAGGDEGHEVLFGGPERPLPSPAPDQTLRPQLITPTSSYPPLSTASSRAHHSLPSVPSSYPLFKHLHGHSYWMTPGLRFGCQYTVYPGDPLRFHSHFLAISAEWEEELDLLDIVGGGRLGTGVKKGYLIGGQNSRRADDTENNQPEEEVRTFCIEWAAM